MSLTDLLASKTWTRRAPPGRPRKVDPAANRAFRAAHQTVALAGEMRSLTGTVRSKVVHRGHRDIEALVLVTDDGTFHLRRPHGHPLHDKLLLRLEHRTIRAVGKLDGDDFFLIDWTIDR
jgi:hypothetical protein